jgi:Flp pilus assembly protein protease CpaA
MVSYLLPFIFVFYCGALLLASVFDVKTREVPDSISYTVIFGGLLLVLLLAVAERSLSVLLFVPLSTLVLFGFAYLMYMLGQWGGGDVKLMLGLSFLFSSIDLYSNLSFISLFINVLIFGGLYGLLSTLIFGVVKFRKLRKFLHLYDIGIVIGAGIAISLSILLVTPPISYLLGFAVFLLAALRYIAIIASSLMFVEIPVGKLTEGDWLADDTVIKDSKTVIERRNIGLLKDDITKLKASGIKKVLIKIGLPFVPGILIGTLVTILFGNPIFSFLFNLH